MGWERFVGKLKSAQNWIFDQNLTEKLLGPHNGRRFDTG
jgi:hypothetical protein